MSSVGAVGGGGGAVAAASGAGAAGAAGAGGAGATEGVGAAAGVGGDSAGADTSAVEKTGGANFSTNIQVNMDMSTQDFCALRTQAAQPTQEVPEVDLQKLMKWLLAIKLLEAMNKDQ